ncbi:Thoeris anti-defense Tad2 family protein [Tenacibaculum halocynthiae]|uniref:Thoeris anti-defense Tad2 family protein n=1 Tax=Tenacibaculum halocynthiae TaxID=1254437 RepID=UPI003893FF53
MVFGEAFEKVKEGKSMRLSQYSEDVRIKAQYPNEHSKMIAPYLYVESRFGNVPWKENNIELFSDKWVVID